MDPISDGDDDEEDDGSEDTLSDRFAPASAMKSRGSRASRRSSMASNNSWGSSIFEDAKRKSESGHSIFADMAENLINSAKKSEGANINLDYNSQSVQINFCNVSAQKSRRGS